MDVILSYGIFWALFSLKGVAALRSHYVELGRSVDLQFPHTLVEETTISCLQGKIEVLTWTKDGSTSGAQFLEGWSNRNLTFTKGRMKFTVHIPKVKESDDGEYDCSITSATLADKTMLKLTTYSFPNITETYFKLTPQQNGRRISQFLHGIINFKLKTGCIKPPVNVTVYWDRQAIVAPIYPCKKRAGYGKTVLDWTSPVGQEQVLVIQVKHPSLAQQVTNFTFNVKLRELCDKPGVCNNGTCKGDKYTYTCTCRHGYTGINCDETASSISELEAQRVLNIIRIVVIVVACVLGLIIFYIFFDFICWRRNNPENNSCKNYWCRHKACKKKKQKNRANAKDKETDRTQQQDPLLDTTQTRDASFNQQQAIEMNKIIT